MAARNRLSELLLRRGIVYFGGTPWTSNHLRWLRGQRFDDPGVAESRGRDDGCDRRFTLPK